MEIHGQHVQNSQTHNPWGKFISNEQQKSTHNSIVTESAHKNMEINSENPFFSNIFNLNTTRTTEKMQQIPIYIYVSMKNANEVDKIYMKMTLFLYYTLWCGLNFFSFKFVLSFSILEKA